MTTTKTATQVRPSKGTEFAIEDTRYRVTSVRRNPGSKVAPLVYYTEIDFDGGMSLSMSLDSWQKYAG